MKKIICVLTAFTAAFTFVSCSDKDTSSVSENSTGKILFTYSSDFDLPPTPIAYEMTFTALHTEPDSIGVLVDAVFGEGAYNGRTFTSKSVIQGENYTEWSTDDYTHDLTLFDNGCFDFTNNDLAEDFLSTGTWAQVEIGDTVYENSFDDTSVKMASGEYTLSEAAEIGGEYVETLFKAIGADIKLCPLKANVTENTDGIQGADIEFASELESQCLRCTLLEGEDNMDNTAPILSITVRMTDIDKIPSVACFGGGLHSDVKKGSALNIISCEEALKFASDKLFASAAHITLDYMRLEYTPTQENNDTYTLAPYWAVYAHSEQGSSLFICIDAQTGETVIQEI